MTAGGGPTGARAATFGASISRKLTKSLSVEKCYDLMIDAHETGCTPAWVGSMEVAELKADQMLSCGADPSAKNRGAEPLRVTVEPTE